MKTLSQKGQAFSVFKLLIAAIVAVFILTFLLQILSSITPPAAGEPNEEAASKIKSLISKLGIAETTKVVNFEPNTRLSARTIADKTDALGYGEICVLLGESDLTNLNIWDPDNAGKSDLGASIFYIGNSKITRKLYIMCDTEDLIGTSVIDYPDDSAVESAFTDISLCGFSGSSKTRVCAVAIVPATS